MLFLYQSKGRGLDLVANVDIDIYCSHMTSHQTLSNFFSVPILNNDNKDNDAPGQVTQLVKKWTVLSKFTTGTVNPNTATHQLWKHYCKQDSVFPVALSLLMTKDQSKLFILFGQNKSKVYKYYGHKLLAVVMNLSLSSYKQSTSKQWNASPCEN